MGDDLKYDTGKAKWALMPMRAIELIVRVLMFGEEKYSRDGWKGLIKDRSRVEDALMRHIISHKEGELLDPETKLPHLAHAGCNIMFLLWFYLEDLKEPEEVVYKEGDLPEYDEQTDYTRYNLPIGCFHKQLRWNPELSTYERFDYYQTEWRPILEWEHV